MRALVFPRLTLTLLGLSILTIACGDDGRADGTSEDEETGLTTVNVTETSNMDETSMTASTTMSDMADTGPMCSDEEIECGDECCSDGQVCFGNTCSDDCGGFPPCDGICCDGDQVCYLGECVIPDGACEESSCATKELTTTCDPGYTCDADLGLCVPSQADPNCQYVPPPNQFSPRPEFTWGMRAQVACMDDSVCQTAEVCMNGFCSVTWPHLAPADAPSNVHVSSIPVVGDLDGDCTPEIIFNTYPAGSPSDNGIVRAINGDTGEQMWSITNPMYQSDGTSNVAIGDIDQDGLPEVVYQGGPAKQLVAVDGDGTPMWISDLLSGSD
jgi:hypothetical protein